MFFLSSDISQGGQQWNKIITIRYYRSPIGHPSIFSMKYLKKKKENVYITNLLWVAQEVNQNDLW